MTAKEMLEELDFKNTLSNNCLLVYERYIENRNNFHSEAVNFHLNDKTMSIINIDEISLQLLQAINKQVKELGWNK